MKKTPMKRTHAPKAMANQPTMVYHEPKSVRITQADNGYTVHQHGPSGETVKVATSHNQAFAHAKQLLGVKPPTMHKKKK